LGILHGLHEDVWPPVDEKSITFINTCFFATNTGLSSKLLMICLAFGYYCTKYILLNET